MKPNNIKKVQRKSRGLIVDRLRYRKHSFWVHSGDVAYEVKIGFDGSAIHAICNCKWGRRGGVGCSHVLAVLEYLANQKQRTLSFWYSDKQAIKQKRKTLVLARGEDRIWITSRKIWNSRSASYEAIYNQNQGEHQ